MLVATEVTGVVTADVGRAELVESAPEEEGVVEELARDVCGAELPLVPEARPVTVEIVGFEDACFEPIVA